MAKIKPIDKAAFQANLLMTIEEINQALGLELKNMKFKIVPVHESGKPLNSSDDILRLIMLSEKNVGARFVSLENVVSLMTWKQSHAPIWINVSYIETIDAVGIFKLETSLRLRKTSVLHNAETGHPPFRAIIPDV